MSNISIKQASLIYGAAKYSTTFVQLIISAILSRLITPSEFGILAIVTVFTTLFNTLASLGLGTAVTQFQDLSHQDTQDIFTFSEYCAFGLAIVFAIMVYPISLFYGNFVYVPIGLWLTLSVFLNALNMIPNALLLKERKFVLTGIRMIIATIVSGIIALVLASMGWKYYALVAQSIISIFIQFIWNFKSTYLKFKLKFSWEPIKKVKNYSTNQFGYNILNYFAQNLDNLLIGKIMGSESLAYYNKGYMLMRYPIDNISHAITPVIHPMLAEYQDNKEYIYNEFIKIAKILSLIGVFITAFCFWADREVILCFFGNQWELSVEPFKMLCLCLGVQLINALYGSIYQSLGCTREMLQSGVIHILISIFSIIMGVLSNNLVTLAIVVSISMFIKFFIEIWFLIKKSFQYPITKFLTIFLPDFLMTTGLFLIAYLVGELEEYSLQESLFIKALIMSVSYLIMLIATRQYKYFNILLPKKTSYK